MSSGLRTGVSGNTATAGTCYYIIILYIYFDFELR